MMSPTLTCLPPFLALDGEPGIKGGLRLFEQGDLFQACLAGRLHGQLACHGVERGGDGQEDFLVLQPVVGLFAGDP